MKKTRSDKGNGAGWITTSGYHRRTDGTRMQYAHRVIAERALGRPLPAGAIVHHVDGDRLNNAPSNLVICPSTSYHQLIHQRQHALETCGEPAWFQCWVCKEWGPLGVIADKGKGSYAHADCLRKYHWLDKLINRRKHEWQTNSSL